MKLQYKYSKLYWFFKDFEFLKVYFSPFKPPIPRLYIGKTAIGVPIFYPRKWVKATPERAHKAVLDYIAREESYNKMNPNYARKIRPYDEVFKEKMRYDYAVSKKVGFDFVGLRWKTKYDSIRFEYNPVWSFVAFGYQIALTFVPENCHHYWECYLAYEYDTDKSKSQKERLKEAKEKHPCTWTSYYNGEKTTTDYWKVVVKDMYEKQVTKG